MWDTKVCQHGSPVEQEALKRGYEPFATVIIPMPVQQSSLVGGAKGMNVLFFMSYRLWNVGGEVWDGQVEVSNATGATS